MSDPTTADEPDVLEQPDASVQPDESDKEPVEADWRQTEPDDTLGLSSKDGDPMDDSTPADNLE